MQVEERRYLQAQVRSAAGGRVVNGIAVRYNALSEDLGSWRERIKPGAFTKTLADGHDVRMLFSHDPARILGSTKSRTLSIQDIAEGLHFRCELPRTADGDTVAELCTRGDLREMSFGFRCEKEDWLDEDDPDDYDDDRSRRSKRKIPVRHVLQASLSEISAVAWPAYANDATHIRPEIAAASAAGSRNLFPGGAIPFEIRSRVPSLSLTPEEDAVLVAARMLELQASLNR